MIRVQVKTFVPPEDTIWLIRDPFGTVMATIDGEDRDADGRLLRSDTALAVLPELAKNLRKARRRGWTAERVLRSDVPSISPALALPGPEGEQPRV